MSCTGSQFGLDYVPTSNGGLGGQSRCARGRATTNRYLHFLGTAADRAGLDRLNSGWGYQGGTKPGATKSGS